MKISGLGPLQGIGSATNVSRSANTQASESLGGGSTVSMSKDASWIESLRASAQEMPKVRTELVAEIRQQLSAGTFEDTVDMDSVIDSMLADF
jgi:flagellar biosynthesis anti-sigma factor FlgM